MANSTRPDLAAIKARLSSVAKLCDSMEGRFFHDEERGDIGFVAAACDSKECDCNENLNSDGDQDCSVSLADVESSDVDNIGPVLVEMLNGLAHARQDVEQLVQRVEELEAISELRGNEVAKWAHESGTAKGQRDQLARRVEELERLIAEVAHDVRIVTEHRAARERGGQHVGTGGPLSAANPSTLAYLERLVRNAKGPTNAD